MPEAHFILIASDAYTINGRRYPALDLAQWRLDNARWGLYPSTNNRHSIKPGDNLLIYVGGLGHLRCNVIGAAKVKAIEEPRTPVFLDPPEVDSLAADRVLALDGIKTFDPVDLRKLLDQLTFIPKNKQKWGSSLMGGCRKIDRKDYEKIVK